MTSRVRGRSIARAPRVRDALIAAALVIAVAAPYAQLRSAEFINLDDGVYVTRTHYRAALAIDASFGAARGVLHALEQRHE